MRAACMRGLAMAVCLLTAAASHAYTPSTLNDTDDTRVTWDLANHETWLSSVDGGEVLYRLNSNGSADVTDGSDLAAIDRAFRTWSGVSGSALRFRRDADTASTSTLNDDQFAIFWSESGTILDQGTAATDDDVSIAGALAVTFVYRVMTGPEAGEIRDANIAFNGADFSWTTTPLQNAGRYDVESVALHEIGHALGLDHSAVATASLFPRIGSGRSDARDLSEDDVAGLMALYPGGNTGANRGSITGLVATDSPLLGALVWARDAAGQVVAQAVSNTAGIYRLEGLPPGPLTLHVQSANDPSGFSMFSINNMAPYYAASRRDFGYLGGVPVTVPAGAEVVANLAPPAGTPAMEIKLVSRAGSWSNISRTLRRGDSGIFVGVAGPGLPAAGTPLTISGSDVSYGSTIFGSIAGLPTIEVQVSLSADAALGTRDLVVTTAFGTTIAIGALEIRHAEDPLEPPEVQGLQARIVEDGLDLSWEPAAATPWYRVLRGSLAGLRSGAYPHTVVDNGCFISVPRVSLMQDLAQAELTYYLVQAVHSDESVGSPGAGSEGFPRPDDASSCP